MRRWLSIVGCFLYILSTGQTVLQDDFEDGDLTSNAPWVGDLEEYAIVDGRLRLAADDAGRSQLFTEYIRPDSISISFNFDINTNPSGGNFSRVYLYVDGTDLSSASGYYLQLGESGSEDAIQLVELDQGSASVVAIGDLGGISSRPSKDIDIAILDHGTFTLVSTDLDDGNVSEEILTFLPWSDLPPTGFFGVSNTYTRSNVTNYSYDDVRLALYEPDRTPPVIVSARVVDSQEVEVVFDEDLLAASVVAADVTLTPALQVRSVDVTDNTLCILLGSPLESGPTYTVTLNAVSDLLGNIAETSVVDIRRAVAPTTGDVVINEILFNPEGSGSDYVEMWNSSTKLLELEGLAVSNVQNGDTTVLEQGILDPGAYLVLTEDPAETANTYTSSDPATFREVNLPSFNNSDGNVTISVGGVQLDLVDYDEDWHFALLDDVDGVSLERINPMASTNDATNWQSASATVGNGTPGLQNSAFVGSATAGDGLLTLIEDTFSPNLDGESDQVVIRYVLPTDGYLCNAYVYDQRGHLQRELYNQELLSIDGLLTWDGLDENNRPLTVGPYILHVQLFDLDGQRIDWQRPVVLAQQLD